MFTFLMVSVGIFLPEFCPHLVENKSDAGMFWHSYLVYPNTEYVHGTSYIHLMGFLSVCACAYLSLRWRVYS